MKKSKVINVTNQKQRKEKDQAAKRKAFLEAAAKPGGIHIRF